MNFIQIQMSHMIPVKTCEPFRVRTGYERVLAHRVSRNFAGIAEKDGTVTKIDDKSKLVEVTYTDGTKDVFKFGEQYVEAESLELTQPIACAVYLGQSFKKNDVITYNTGYFTQDHFTKQLDFSIGVTANVAMLETDTTNEDSTEISQELADKLAINPVNIRVVKLSAKSLVHKCVKIGMEVIPTDPLMIFEEDPVTSDDTIVTDEEALSMLSDLNRSTPKAKFSGKIVKIDAYTATSELSPTLSSIVTAACADRTKAYKLAKDTDKSSEFPPVTLIPKGSKYKGVDFDDDTVMLIFHIQEYLPHGVGDKIVVCNQLKCTCASVFSKPIITESGTPIDLFFSQKAQNNRIVLSPILTGISSRIMEKLECDVVAEYFK